MRKNPRPPTSKGRDNRRPGISDLYNTPPDTLAYGSFDTAALLTRAIDARNALDTYRDAVLPTRKR